METRVGTVKVKSIMTQRSDYINNTLQRLSMYFVVAAGLIAILLFMASASSVSAASKPAKVKGLKAEVSGEDIYVKWSKVSKATGYQVYMDGEKIATVKGKTSYTVSSAYLGEHQIKARAYRSIKQYYNKKTKKWTAKKPKKKYIKKTRTKTYTGSFSNRQNVIVYSSIGTLEPETVRIGTQEGKPYNCVETDHYVFCIETSNLYRVSKETGKVKKLDSSFEGRVESLKVWENTIFYEMNTANALVNANDICAIDVKTGRKTFLTRDSAGYDFEIIDGYIYYPKYIIEGEPELYSVRMSLDGKVKIRSPEQMDFDEQYLAPTESNSEAYRIEFDSDYYYDSPCYLVAPQSKILVNADNPLVFYNTKDEIGSTLSSVDAKYSIRENLISGMDNLHYYKGEKISYKFVFTATDISENGWDYEWKDTDKCIGMYGNAKNLLGINKKTSVNSFIKRINRYVPMDEGRGAGFDTSTYKGLCIDLFVRDETECRMLLKGVKYNGYINPSTKVYVDQLN